MEGPGGPAEPSPGRLVQAVIFIDTIKMKFREGLQRSQNYVTGP